MTVTILVIVARLVGLTVAGYLLFQISILRRHILEPLLKLLVNLLLPLYLFHRLATGWESALELGWEWTLIFFFGCLVTVAVQSALGAFIVYRTKLLPTKNPREVVALFGVHNAVFIPFPILAVLAPEEINVFLFFYFFAFVLTLWSYLVSLLSGNGGFRFKVTMPLIAMIISVLLVIPGWHSYLPVGLLNGVGVVGRASLELILVVLGGILATIPKKDLAYKPEFGRLVVLRMLIYPLIVFALAWFIPESLGESFRWGLRITLIVEAAVPPATNVLLIAKAFGTDKQVHYIGGAVLTSYLASIVTMPLFFTLAIVLFR